MDRLERGRSSTCPAELYPLLHGLEPRRATGRRQKPNCVTASPIERYVRAREAARASCRVCRQTPGPIKFNWPSPCPPWLARRLSCDRDTVSFSTTSSQRTTAKFVGTRARGSERAACTALWCEFASTHRPPDYWQAVPAGAGDSSWAAMPGTVGIGSVLERRAIGGISRQTGSDGRKACRSRPS